jgi:chemotaxis protein methyltransferase CheR
MSFKKKLDLGNEADPFEIIAQTISEITGVQLGEKQKALVYSRLGRRFRELGGIDPHEYLAYFKENREDELSPLISLLTTHHTFFFREFSHFEFVIDNLPKMVANAKKEGRRSIRIWSAACSYGHEVYSLAMLMKFHLSKIDPNMDFFIFGTDVCEESVDKAKKGIYKWDDLKRSPQMYIKGHWLRGSGDIADFVRAKDDLKRHVAFDINNLQAFSPHMNGQKFDVVFCRNVFIYFTHEQIYKITTQFQDHLYDDGHLIVGLSETLMKNPSELSHIGKSVYHKGEATEEEIKAKSQALLSKAPIAKEEGKEDTKPREIVNFKPKELINVLCVDDSPVVLKILQKILSPSKGFKVVGTAENGLEAAKFLKANDNVDVLTLDIHMPEQSGVDYLAANFNKAHPPVVMVSSVSQEDSDLALRAIELGASDYLEKPTMENFEFVAEELIRKLKVSSIDVDHEGGAADVIRSFGHSSVLSNTDDKLKIFFAGIGERKKVKYFVKELKAPQPPVFIIMENIEKFAPKLQEEYTKDSTLKVCRWSEGDKFLSNRIYLLSTKEFEIAKNDCKDRQTVAALIADPSREFLGHMEDIKKIKFVTEDVGKDRSTVYARIYEKAAMQVPYTSMAYETDKLMDEE